MGGTVFAIIVILVALAPVLSPYPPNTMRAGPGLSAPSAEHWMGTDRFGRDMTSRVLWGGRTTLPVGFIAVGLGLTMGVTLGLIAGYAGGHVDNVIMRVMDVMLAFPGVLMALFVITVLGVGMTNLMIAVGISSVPLFVRLTRGVVLSVRELDYVQAARALGGSDSRIMLRHILPNILAPIVVLATTRIATAIITASALSYIGLGVQPPTSEWGKLLAEAQEVIYHAWWLVVFPGAAIVFTVLSVNLLGDGLRDALDPRLRGR